MSFDSKFDSKQEAGIILAAEAADKAMQEAIEGYFTEEERKVLSSFDVIMNVTCAMISKLFLNYYKNSLSTLVNLQDSPDIENKGLDKETVHAMINCELSHFLTALTQAIVQSIKINLVQFLKED